MKRSNKKMTKRLMVLLGISLLILIIYIGRLFYLQVIDADNLKKRAMEQWTKGTEISPKRGMILDRNGKKMAISINAHTLWANPKEIKNKKEASKQLAKIIASDEKEILKKLETNKNSVKLQQWLSGEEIDKLKKIDLKGIQISEGNRRYYPNGDFASYILGFTNIDNEGLNGIEKTYDDSLSGESGKKVGVKDRRGYQLPYDSETTYDPENGFNIVLTLDENIQKIAEEAADKVMKDTKAKNVSILVMEPNSGDLLALANNPDYDPNDPRKPKDDETSIAWEGLDSKELEKKWYEMWRNYAISDIYEPGSTFKTIMAAAAIEENVANPNTNFYCSGFIRDIPGQVLKCSRWYRPHYNINLKDGLGMSCNVVFVDLARKLGKDATLKYIKAFGFGEKTGVELLGEQLGLIPKSPESIRDVQLATISYGHGIAVTPIQLITAVSAISNGGNLMTPRLVSHIVDNEGNIVKEIKPELKRKVISESTSKTMLDMMEAVVSKGTGRNAYVPGYRVAGKTGTAQKVVEKGYMPGKYIGSFIAVAPADNPRIAVSVIVDEPEGAYYGGSVAAPAAAEVIEKALSYLEVEQQFTDKEKREQKDTITVPNLIGLSLESASESLIREGLKYSVDTDTLSEKTKVIKQFPEAGTKLVRGSIIDLYLEEGKGIEKSFLVPDLKGKTRDEAVKELDKLGVKYNISGKGKVKSQEPSAGQNIEKNTVIKVELTNENN